MGETKETPKDALQESGQTSEGGKGITPKVTVKTYTESELQKAKSDALAAAGRDAKALAEKEAALKADREAVEAEKAKIADWEKRREQAELDEARRDPDKLAAWQKKQTEKTRDAEFATRESTLKKREQDLAKREAEHEAEIKAARETQTEIELWKIGAKYGVDPVMLKELNLPVEQAEAVAKRLGTAKRSAEGEEKFSPDSGVTSGTGKESSKGKSAAQIFADNFRKQK